MKEDALSRLMKTNNSNNSNYTLDEQLEEVDDDFMGAMSDESKSKMFDTIRKMEYSEDEPETEVEEIEDEYTQIKELEDEETTQVQEQQYAEPKRGRGRPRKEVEQSFEQPVQKQIQKPIQQMKQPVYSESKQEEPPRVYYNSVDLSSFMDSLAKDLIEELRVSNYSTRNFSHSQMLTILNYIEQKI